MTKNTEKKEAAKPIQDWENREVKGDGRVSKGVFDNHVTKVAELRARQQAYEASLPKRPEEALQEISRCLKNIGDPGESEYRAGAALEIIRQLANYGALDDSDNLKEALTWLVDQGLDGLRDIEDGAQRACDIARQFHPAHRAFEA